MKLVEFEKDEVKRYFPGFTVYDGKTGEKVQLDEYEFFVLDEDGLLLKLYPNNADLTFDDVQKEGKYVISFRDGTYMRW